MVIYPHMAAVGRYAEVNSPQHNHQCPRLKNQHILCKLPLIPYPAQPWKTQHPKCPRPLKWEVSICTRTYGSSPLDHNRCYFRFFSMTTYVDLTAQYFRKRLLCSKEVPAIYLVGEQCKNFTRKILQEFISLNIVYRSVFKQWLLYTC